MSQPAETTRPTPLAERTMVGVAAGFCMQALIFGVFLLLPSWPKTERVAELQIHYLGAALIISSLGNLLTIIGFMSPWLGSVRIRGWGAQVDVNGDAAPEVPDHD
jgi:hypothetical protein